MLSEFYPMALGFGHVLYNCFTDYQQTNKTKTKTKSLVITPKHWKTAKTREVVTHKEGVGTG